jgi:hypothetical protein
MHRLRDHTIKQLLSESTKIIARCKAAGGDGHDYAILSKQVSRYRHEQCIDIRLAMYHGSSGNRARIGFLQLEIWWIQYCDVVARRSRRVKQTRSQGRTFLQHEIGSIDRERQGNVALGQPSPGIVQRHLTDFREGRIDLIGIQLNRTCSWRQQFAERTGQDTGARAGFEQPQS